MAQKHNYMSKDFLVWFLANILGFGILGILIIAFPSVMTISGFFVTIFIITIPISFAQWMALRRILKTSILWILTMPIGTPLGFYIIRVIPDGLLWFDADDDSLIAMTSMIFIVGLIIGLLQWLILRMQLARASVWLFGSAFSIAVSFWFILVTDVIHQSGFFSYFSIALVYSIASGLFLSGLLRYNRNQIDIEKATYR